MTCSLAFGTCFNEKHLGYSCTRKTTLSCLRRKWQECSPDREITPMSLSAALPEIRLYSQQQQQAFGAQLAGILPKHAVIFLEGDLGTGKTTLVRGILRGFGWPGTVKSPTYTILEPYELPQQKLYHFDLYRLADAEELEYLGLRELLGEGLLFFEWPERGEAALPRADITVIIQHHGAARVLKFDIRNPQLRQRIASVINKFPTSPLVPDRESLGKGETEV